MSVPLLMTKLFIPVPAKYLVGRKRLVDKLNQCLEPDCRLALISAPAGFGKTTLISAWIASARNVAPGMRLAWLAIDEADNDPVMFWRYFIAAVQTQQAGVGQQTMSVLSLPEGDLERKLTSLINDLVQIPNPCVVVLDDYHRIRNPLIHQSLAFFIEHAPPHVHLMIASRIDPPLPLAMLRGRGQLLEIRLNDLRFTDDDADAYLNASIGLNLAIQSVQALNKKTEGWIAGLQMATLALQEVSTHTPADFPGQNTTADFVASFSGSNRFILDYLIEEVLNRQTEPVQQFLIQTSILDRLCGSLCDSILKGSGAAESGAQSVLEYLEGANLFIFPLDNQRFWYRYHQLFSDLLSKRLMQVAPEVIEDLHRRAIQWYEQNGMIPSAIQHAFRLKDFHKAVSLVAQVTEVMWGRGEHATLLAWMDALPDDAKKPYPNLLVFQVSMLISSGKLQEAEASVAILEQYIQASLKANSEQSALIGKVSALRTYIASFYGDRPALFAHAHTALQNLIREEDTGQRCGISLVLGNAYLTEGKLEAADRAFVEAIADAKKARKPHMVVTGLSNLAVVLWNQGNLSRMAQVCKEGFPLISQYSLDRSPMAADIYLGWGEILCLRGELAEAAKFIQQGLSTALEQNYIWQTAWGYQATARLYRAQNKMIDAEASAQAAVDWCDTHDVPAYVDCEAAGLLAELWLLQGKTAPVERFLQDRQIQADGDLHFPHQSEYLAMARLKWIQGDAEGANRILDRITLSAETLVQTGVRIKASLLQALVYQSRGMHLESLTILERALELAEPDGYLQAFVEDGESMRSLLQEAVVKNIHPDYASRMLSAFPVFSNGEKSGNSPVTKLDQQRALSSAKIPLVEPLSRREMETLQFIAEGLSNKEIALKLSISLRTVKYYSTGLYNKLGVDSRMQAVVRARELGLI